jgi:hypothetical protein
MLSFVTTEEVVALFNIFFDHINVRVSLSLNPAYHLINFPLKTHCSLLDRNFHTPSLVCSRSPFLLTTSKLPVYPKEVSP